MPGSAVLQPEVLEQADERAGAVIGAEPEFELVAEIESAFEVGVGVGTAHIPEVEPANSAVDIAEQFVVETRSVAGTVADMGCNQDTAGSIAETVAAVDTIAL